MSFAFNPSHFPETTSEFPPRRQARKSTPFNRLLRLLGFGGKGRAVRSSRSRVHTDWAREVKTMVAAGDEMLRRSRNGKFALSVAVFDLSDLPELKSVFGARIVQEVIIKITAKFQAVASGRGLVVRTDPTVFTVLLPGFGRDRALTLIRDVMGHPCCIELDGSDEEIVLMPEFRVQTVRPETNSIAQVYETLRCEIAKAHQLEQKRRRYLQRERESHTRPMEARSAKDSGFAQDRAVESQPPAPTIPMPLPTPAR